MLDQDPQCRGILVLVPEKHSVESRYDGYDFSHKFRE